MTWRARLDEVLFGPETGGRLALVRTGLLLLVGVRIALGPYRDLAGTPDALFEPAGVLWWLDHMPSTTTIAAIQVVGACAVAAALVWPRRSRLPAIVGWVCLLVLAGLRSSRGKVLHNDLLLLWVVVPFLVAPLEARWGDRTPSRAWGWPVRSGMAIAAVVYALSGFHKLVTTGIDWALGDNIRNVLLWGSPASPRWDSLSTWLADHALAYRSLGLAMLLVELTFPLVLVWRRLQPWYALAAVALHVATYVLLGLDYWAWAAVAGLLFVDWSNTTPASRRRASKGSPSVAT